MPNPSFCPSLDLALLRCESPIGNGTPCQGNPPQCLRAPFLQLGQKVSAWPTAQNSLTYFPHAGKMISYKQTRTRAKISLCIQPVEVLSIGKVRSLPHSGQVLRVRLNFVEPQVWHHLSPYVWGTEPLCASPPSDPVDFGCEPFCHV